jgi:polyphosphate glucokinase
MESRPVLVVDVGGSHVKLLASGETERRRFESGPDLGPERMVASALEAAEGWSWEVASLGIPTPVLGGRPIAEPVNLGEGWVGFDYEGAFGKPTKIVNDAVMQAIGSYEGGACCSWGSARGSARP